MPYNGESVTIDGTDPVTNWTVYQGAVYKTSVVLNSDDTNQLFVDAQMMTEARWPNGNDVFHPNWRQPRRRAPTTRSWWTATCRTSTGRERKFTF